MIVAAVATVVAVNRGDNANDAATGTTAPAASSATSSNAGPAPAGPTADAGGKPGDPATSAATTMEQLEARWTADRAAVVAALSAPGMGLGPDNIVRGPGGLQVDLSHCPSGWSNSDGVTPTTVTLGQIAAQTGILASSAQLTAGLQAYVGQVNAAGGIGGRTINLVVKDDQFVATNTVKAVDELLTTDKPLAITTLGSPTSLAVYDKLNAACVPQPFVVSSHPAWADPQHHPWTTGLQLDPSAEAELWGAWIQRNLSDALPVKVGALVMDNEVGQLYQQGLQAWASAHPGVISEIQGVSHSPTASSVKTEMATVAAGQPAVFIAMTAGRPCLQAVQEAAATGLSTSARALFMPSICRDPATFMAPAGAAGQGWRIVGGGVKAPNDSRYPADPYLAFVTRSLTAAGLDPANNLAATGFGLFGWAQVEALRIAADLPGGLTRANLLLALHGLQLHHPMVLDGLSFAENGNDDGHYLEGSDILGYDATAQSWTQDGPVIDLNGSTPNCAWTAGHC